MDEMAAKTYDDPDMKRLAIPFLACIAVVFVAGILWVAFRIPRTPSTTDRLTVAATIFPVADMIKQVGGAQVDVITLLPPGASPHTFEPSPQTITSASQATALFKIGVGLDDWSQRVIDAGSQATIVDLSAQVRLQTLGEEGLDPHYWLSAENARAMTHEITEALISLDPAHAADFRRNAEEYQQQLAELHEELRRQFATVTTTQFATFHEAWYYFAQAYGLTVVASFEPSPGKEPTAQFLATFMDTIKRDHIRVVFTEPQFSNAALDQAAHDLGVTINLVDPIGGGSEETNSYINMMRYNAKQISSALR